jgi:hypothetical protein
MDFAARVSVNQGNWYSFGKDGGTDIHEVEPFPAVLVPGSPVMELTKEGE